MDNPVDRAISGNANATALQTPDAVEEDAVNGQALLIGVAILFAAFLATLCLHIAARWFFLRRASRVRRRARRAPLVFSSERPQQSGSHQPYTAPPDHGLDPAVLESLLVFSYSTAAAEVDEEDEEEEAPPECAVCLCEFEDGDRGRVLSPCGHRFHADCIDMWFFSHSTCPLCRAVVERPPPAAAAAEPCCELCRWMEGRPVPAGWDSSVPTSSVPAHSGATEAASEAGWKSLDGGYFPTIRGVMGWDLGFHCGGGSANVFDLESGVAAGRGGQQAPRTWW